MGTCKGISYPFRVAANGGIAMSDTSTQSVTHLAESLTQIIQTYRYERAMEYYIYCDALDSIFQPSNLTLDTLISKQISEAISRLEPRVKVISIQIDRQDSEVRVFLTFIALAYNTTSMVEVKIEATDVK